MSQPTVTMRDIAERAGVAVSTVSRVMSTPERISAPTRKLVLDAARELGYRSNQPRGQAGRIGSVALVVPDITNPFYFEMIRGSQERLRDSGYTQLLIDAEESPHAELAALESIADSCAGAVLAATRLSDDQIRDLADRMPLVTVNREVEGIPRVLLDTPSAFGQVVDHLVSLGHRRVCYVAGPKGSATDLRRWAAVEAAAERHGIDAVRIGPFNPKPNSGAAAADALLTSGATAGLAYNDVLAIGMLQRFAVRGVSVPGEVSITGCDDIFGADFCSPPLTTITAPTRRVGNEATAMLLALAAGAEPRLGRRLELPVHLTIRDSTGPAPASAG